MKKNVTSGSPLNHQGGFSILEILVATVLISSLIASGIYYINLGDKANLVSNAAVKNAVAVRFPEAMISIYSGKQTLVGTGAADLVETGSVRLGAPVTWAVATGGDAPTKDTLQINLTFDEDREAELIKDYLDTYKDSLMVSKADIKADNKKLLMVTYEIN